MIGAGSVVTHDVPPKAIVVGNPAQIVGYVDATRAPAAAPGFQADQAPGTSSTTSVTGVTLHQMQFAIDLRGALSAGEYPGQLPFEPKRYFLVYDVPGTDVRGEHAHRECHQFLVCARGAVSVVVDDGARMQEIRLDRPNLGIYVPPLVWAVQYKYTPDALLMVLASAPYDPADYIRDYDEFLSIVRR